LNPEEPQLVVTKSAASSSWTALRNRTFRAIWLASLISGICASAHSTAATWAMNQLSHSALLLSMISTFTSLPFFLFTLPAGAIADMMDRGRLVSIMHIWLAAATGGLAVLGWFNLLNGYLILLFVFLISVGFAFNAPAFCSLLTDIVSSEELPSATVLNGLQLDLSGMIGSALGGALIPLIGTNTIFAANGAAFLLFNLALLQWREPKAQPQSVMENFFQSFATAVRYVRYAPGMQVILVREILFSLLVAAIPALLPVVALNELHIGVAELGLLYTSMSAGSVITAAFILPWGRARYLPDTLTKLAAYLFVLVMVLLAFVRQTQLLPLIAVLTGVAWTSTANELWLAGQRAMPAWARGRMNATVIMFSQGAIALGGIIYGAGAQTWGAAAVLIAVAAVILVLLLTVQLFSVPLSIDFTKELNIEPGPIAPFSLNFIHAPRPADGPVLITIDVQLDKSRGPELDAFVNELRLIYLRNGAYSWQLFADPTRPNRFHVQIMMPSWSQYLLLCERITKDEKQLIDQAQNLHVGENPPEIQMYVRVNKRFHDSRP
jgi:MFS family permease